MKNLHRTAAFGAAMLLGASVLAACGSSDNSSDSSKSGGGSGGGINAACKLTSPPKSQAKAVSNVNLGKASGKVGVILPDTTSSTRYTLYDAPLLKQQFKAAGVTADIQNAQGDKNRFASIAQSMIGEGVKVLIIDSIDAASGAGVEKAADKAGVKVIDYDRINLGGTAPYYVSFDNEDVGRLQGQALLDCLSAQGVKSPKIIMMDGGTDTDNNAVLFKKGAHEVLDKSDADIVSEQVVKGWTVSNAAPAFQQALTAAGGQVDGVLAANDDIANAVIGVLKNQGLDGHVVLTGQDAAVEGMQNIINGKQSMTIYKEVKSEANAAAALAIALLQGKDPAKVGLALSPFSDPQSPSHKVQALLLPSEVVTQANIADPIKSGALKQAEVCKGIAAACAKLGLS